MRVTSLLRLTGDASVVVEDDASIAAHDTVDRRDARQLVRRTDAFLLQALANLPGEYLRIVALVLPYASDDIRRGHFRLRATDETWMGRAEQTVSNHEETDAANGRDGHAMCVSQVSVESHRHQTLQGFCFRFSLVASFKSLTRGSKEKRKRLGLRQKAGGDAF